MECKKVQDQLITEYVDKESGPEENAEIQRHLTACLGCREFFEEVQKNAVAPFQGAGPLQPDSAVWARVLEKIEAEQASAGRGFWKLVDDLISRFPFPVPVMRVAFVTALILAVVVLANWPSSYADPVYGYLSEQMTFMSGLRSGNTDLMTGELKDYDAAFEGIGARGNFYEGHGV